jgi:hypothetical protein
LLFVMPSCHATRSAGRVRERPQDQVDHTIWALSRGVTFGDRPSAAEQQVSGIRSSVPRIPARFWTQALGWKVLSERENEIVIGTDENAPTAWLHAGHRPQDG